VSNPLQWDVFVSTQIPVVTSDLPPGVANGDGHRYRQPSFQVSEMLCW
jgi:hypothetical protein